MTHPWPQLNFWNKDWENVSNRLDVLRLRGVDICPSRDRIFDALQLPPEEVKVCIVGQDPYPGGGHATGRAFAVPSSVSKENFPPTLRTIFRELKSDLGYDLPSSGTLRRWTDQGVLLWNAYPSLEQGKSLSHEWGEYSNLTDEIISVVSERGIVFCFLGAKARSFVTPDLRASTNNVVLEYSHPSPRGSSRSTCPFVGSRMFSTINASLNSIGLPIIDWRLT